MGSNVDQFNFHLPGNKSSPQQFSVNKSVHACINHFCKISRECFMKVDSDQGMSRIIKNAEVVKGGLESWFVDSDQGSTTGMDAEGW